MFDLHGVEFDFQKELELVGLDFAVDDGAKAVAEELDGVMIFEEGGVFGEDALVSGFMTCSSSATMPLRRPSMKSS